MRRLCLTFALALLAAACGTPEGSSETPDASVAAEKETVCTNGVDDDADGKIDCLDSDCLEVSPCTKPCAKQADCGDIVQAFSAKVCVPSEPAAGVDAGVRGSRCIAPGLMQPSGDAEKVQLAFDLSFASSFVTGTPPGTVIFRFVHPKKVDGSALTCAELVTLNGATVATATQLDQNPAINQVYRYGVNLQTIGSGSVMNVPAATGVPAAQSLLLYGEAWYNNLSTANNPTGNRASVFCAEGKSTEVAPGTRFQLSFK